jgi:hypothetical protein
MLIEQTNAEVEDKVTQAKGDKGRSTLIVLNKKGTAECVADRREELIMK